MHDFGYAQAENESFHPYGAPAHPYNQGGIHFQEVPLHETSSEAPTHEADAYEMLMQEAEEMELATELLEVSNEHELDQFLGSLISKVGKGLGDFVKSPVGQALGGVLKSAAKAALPIAGSALGGLVGGPAGAALGGNLASSAGHMFGLELEGLSSEDREFEVARRFVRLAHHAALIAAKAAADAGADLEGEQFIRGPYRFHPHRLARFALNSAARRLRFRFPPPWLGRRPPPPMMPYPQPPDFAPDDAGDFGGDDGGSSAESMGEFGVGGQQGTWVRRGRCIILYGA
jgi:hypothetical protein